MATRSTASTDKERLRRLEKAYADIEARLRRLESPPLARPVDYSGWIQNPPVSPVPVPQPARSRVDVETLLGGNLLAKAGMAVLVLGVVFFLKYAFDQGWIDERGRIALGVVGGLAIAALGDLLFVRRRYGVYPQVLSGGGFVILYFTVFVAYAFPEYRSATGMSLEMDVVLLGLAALGLAAYAAWRDTPVLAGEAAVLGGVTAVVADTWQTFAIGYVLLLAVAIVAATGLRRWPFVAATTMVIVYADLAIGLLQKAPAEPVLGAAAGLLALFSLAAFRLRGRLAVPEAQALAAGAFVGAWLVALFAYEQRGWDDAGGPTTLVLALLAGGLALGPRIATPLRLAWSASFCLLALAWPPIQFDGAAVPLAWAALAVGAGAAFLARTNRVVLVFMLTAAGLADLHLFDVEAARIAPQAVPVDAFAAFVAGTAAGIWAWWAARRGAAEAVAGARVALGLALTLPLVFTQVALEGFQVAIAWAGEGLVLVAVGFSFGVRDLRLAGLAAFGLVLAHVFLVDISALSVVVRIVTFLAVGALILVASFLFARSRKAGPGGPVPPKPSPRR